MSGRMIEWMPSAVPRKASRSWTVSGMAIMLKL
jgi:hypothetical protein